VNGLVAVLVVGVLPLGHGNVVHGLHISRRVHEVDMRVQGTKLVGGLLDHRVGLQFSQVLILFLDI
jgi:hypothetical protein